MFQKVKVGNGLYCIKINGEWVVLNNYWVMLKLNNEASDKSSATISLNEIPVATLNAIENEEQWPPSGAQSPNTIALRDDVEQLRQAYFAAEEKLQRQQTKQTQQPTGGRFSLLGVLRSFI